MKVVMLFGWWVLWAYTGGWEGVWAGTREECLQVLKMTSVLSVPLTCVPAGVLLRPLRLRGVETQPATIQGFAEWDVAPEFRP